MTSKVEPRGQYGAGGLGPVVVPPPAEAVTDLRLRLQLD